MREGEGVEDWMSLVQDTVQSRGIVNTVIGLQDA
jgi:hypothetical protein